MRKFFSFRSPTASNGKDDPVPLRPNPDNIFWETPWENSTDNFAGAEVQERFQTNEESSTSCPQRSASFSSPVYYRNCAKGNNFLSDPSVSTRNNSDILHQNADVQLDYLSQIPERFPKLEINNDSEIRKTDTLEKFDSPSSSRRRHGSAQNSPYGSPVPLKYRSASLTQISDRNRTVDIFIDGEQQGTRSDKGCKQPSCSGNYYHLAESRMFPCIHRPPIFRHTAPASPNYSKENKRSCSFGEEKGICHDVFTQDHKRENLQPLSPRRYARKVIERLCHVLPGRSKVKLQDSDSETTTTLEEIYEDTSDLHYHSNPNSPVQEHALSNPKPVLVYETYGHDREESVFSQRQSRFLGEDHMSELEHAFCLEKHAEEIDRELLRKLEETEAKIMLLPEMDNDIEKIHNGSLCASALTQIIRNIIEDRKNLTSELSFQLRCRIAERSSMKSAFNHASIDLNTRTKKLAKAKDKLLSSLENELDRRSSDWLLNLAQFQAEEHMLREHMRDLAEENISLQREVSSLSGREKKARSRVMDSELQFNCLKKRLEEATNENEKLHQVLSELQECCDEAKAAQDCIARTYKDKEKENKELQKAVVRLQRICNEQERTINGLRLGFSDEIMKQSSERGELATKLQNEQVRLTGVEQKLRREVESYRFEVESLRHENIHLLERLRGVGNSCGISFFRLDQELYARVDCLMNQALSLLNDSIELCVKLLELAKGRQYEHGQEAAEKFNDYSVVEYDMKLASLRKAIQVLNGSLRVVSKTLDEKTIIGASKCQLQTAEGGLFRQRKSEALVDEMEYELKAETLLTRVLQEKLCYKELEVEQLQFELANSVRGNEILKSEIQRLQDDLSCLGHKTKDMELQMMKKDNNLSQLQCDLQECSGELIIFQGMLPKISVERDHLWEEMKQLKEINMLLECEVKSLKKKIEALDEDILMKEGQITMLKDSRVSNPFALEFSWE
uniref:Myosin-11 n=1 Tax=Anthurium amnicola TaxID=1678845 RepID=A0A1D1ZES8_9ARAE